MKKIVQKGNKQLTVSEEMLDVYLNLGYVEIDEKTGKPIQKEPASKEAALKKENADLKKENKALREQIKALTEGAEKQ